MKFNILHLLVVFFLVALIACKQEKEELLPPDDTDNTSMSEKELDEFLRANKFSDPAGNLYGKPLEEIQRSIIGKWKVAISFGGVVGIQCPDNQYITINDKTFNANFGLPEGDSSFEYEWKYLKTYDGYETYVLWDKQNDNNNIEEEAVFIPTVPTGFVFTYLLNNDTLVMDNYSLPAFSDILFRVKD